jgi:ribosomal protein S18 acetylase RimI-like enzyme
MKLNKWDKEHQSNMAAYEREIDKIFQTAAREAAVLAAAAGDFKADKPFSFDDYPATRKKIEKLLSGLKSSIYAVVVNGINTEWGLSNEKNDELVYSSIGKQWTGKRGGQHTVRNSKRYFNNNDDAREAFIERKISGLNLSDRVWKYTEQFKSEIEMGIEFGLRDGLSADEMSRDLRQYLRYPDKLFRRVRNEYGTLVLSKAARAFHPGAGVYRSSYKNARRLAATETNIAYRTADYVRWQQLDFVVGIEIRLSNNHTLNGQPFEDICDFLKGRYPKDFKFTGWHPHCRCHAITILKTPEEMEADNLRMLAGEPVSGDSVNSVKDVPEKFKKWVSENDDRIKRSSSIPYFLRDNQLYVTNITTSKAATQAVRVAALADIRNEYRVRQLSDESKYTDGIAAKFDFLGFKRGMIDITQPHGIKLEQFELAIYNRAGFRLSMKGTGFNITRTFSERTGGIEVHHDYFSLAKNYQGQGISKDVFRLLYEQYRRMGVRYISVDANIDVGGYTWARYGFMATRKSEVLSAIEDCQDAAIREKAEDFVNKYYKKHSLDDSDPFPMRLLTEQDWGKKVLLGSFWEGIIDLQDNKMRKVFENYLGL